MLDGGSSFIKAFSVSLSELLNNTQNASSGFWKLVSGTTSGQSMGVRTRLTPSSLPM